jgi:hypothetical protein
LGENVVGMMKYRIWQIKDIDGNELENPIDVSNEMFVDPDGALVKKFIRDDGGYEILDLWEWKWDGYKLEILEY